MKGPHKDDVQQVIFEFTQRCFVQGVPAEVMTPDALSWVRDCLRESSALTPAAVAAWPAAHQRALYEILQAAIVMLGLQPPFHFPNGDLDGSSASGLGQPLMRGLSSARLTNGS